MNTASIQIDIKAVDCFLYMDKMFIINEDNDILYIDSSKFYNKYLLPYEDNITSVKSLFIDNKLINTGQINKDRPFRNYFQERFSYYGKNLIKIKIDKDDLTKLESLKDLYVLDFVVYAKKLLIASKSGVYESNLNISNGSVFQEKKTERIHDVRSKDIITKLGEVLVISNYDGIFRGSLWKNYSSLSIQEKPAIENMTHINWMKHDVIGLDINNYTLYENEVKEVETLPGANFILGENDPMNKRIVKFAKEKVSLSEVVNNVNNLNDVVYAYNSNNYIFLVNSSGSVRAIKIDVDKNIENTFLITDSLDINNLGKPLSAHMIGNKSVVFEFFDRIIILRNGKIEVVSKEEVLQIKGFANSKNYQNIFVTVAEDNIKINSVNPIRPRSID